MMTEEEKNTPITFGMFSSILEEVEEILTPQINAVGEVIDKRCDTYEKFILKLADTCSKTIEELNILRAFVIAVYADQHIISIERATQIYRDYANKFSNIFNEAKED